VGSRTRTRIAGTLIAGLLLIAGAAGCAVEDDPAGGAAPQTTERAGSDPAPSRERAPEPEPDEPDETAGQENARRSAESYLDTQLFSCSGLIEQLEFEGYSTADATYGVDAVDPDWKEQAARSAENYLDFQAFSRSGLIQQLEFEGFTPAQARYGVDQTGL
jgi:hypothetical protein